MRLDQVQLPRAHAPSVGPLEVPRWQVLESSHHPQELRPTQPPQLPLLAQESPGVVHWLFT